jgi:hypothetical protein
MRRKGVRGRPRARSCRAGRFRDGGQERRLAAARYGGCLRRERSGEAGHSGMAAASHAELWNMAGGGVGPRCSACGNRRSSAGKRAGAAGALANHDRTATRSSSRS